MLQALSEGPGDPDPQPSDFFVLLHSSRVARVELRFTRDDGKGLGFGVSSGDG